MLSKRLFDLFFVIPGLLVLAPFLLVIALIIKLKDGGNVLFKQVRVGKNGKHFDVLKFRTMVLDAEKLGNKVTTGDDPRITPIGSVLRKYKLDELPQLINVLKGEMSLVGPRPEVPEYVEFYPEETRSIVLSVPPGMTDKASIEFVNENDLLSGSEDPVSDYKNKVLPIKLKYYVEYVKERSLWMDFKLIIKTVIAIF
ncbi:sugar transferase [Cocleimonas sp. KMM 6892]|uniref:sugar transferase n=1 Tax=unclassified Cocleimonas TaxID=2639732 RepID=UPI002DBAFDBE|nr:MULTISPECIES: sugar transferase [unclassified Cocleimonas]MEB8434093.1 sugar transferase [Cocleimonas sp. KMM 6892]MEC4717047.1 sugar transferase [Cocleimonas sp. KMM 6895]MEC4746365.1 sugar transferase [Cocleimonas sp. KMM 6896]